MRPHLTVAGERERTVADLHDHIVQQLFAAGLSLQGLIARLGPGPAAQQLQESVDDLDDAIRRIRISVLESTREP